MTHPRVEAACRVNGRRLLATGAFLTAWGVGASIPLLAQSSADFWYVLWCRQTYALTGPVGKVLAWLSLLLFLVGAAQAGWKLIRGVALSFSLRRQFRLLAVPPPSAVLVAARAAGLTGRLWYVSHPQPVALTLGLIRPQVVLSDTAAEGLSEAELQAILLHEAAHGQNRDPLRHLLWSSLSAGFGLLPGFPGTARAAKSCAELRADARAAETPGGSIALSQALLKIARRTAQPLTPPGSVGFHDDLLLRARSLAGHDVSEVILLRAAKRTTTPWFIWATGTMALISLVLPACLPN